MILSGGMTIAGGTSIVSAPAEPTYTFKWFFGETISQGVEGNILNSSAVIRSTSGGYAAGRANNQIGWVFPLNLANNSSIISQISSLASNNLANAMVTGTTIDLFGTGGAFVETVTLTENARIIYNWLGAMTGTDVVLVANVNTTGPGFLNTNVYFKSNIATINWTI